mgnify:FL=1
MRKNSCPFLKSTGHNCFRCTAKDCTNSYDTSAEERAMNRCGIYDHVISAPPRYNKPRMNIKPIVERYDMGLKTYHLPKEKLEEELRTTFGQKLWSISTSKAMYQTRKRTFDWVYAMHP